MTLKEPHHQRKRLVFLPGGVCSDYLCDYAATGFVLDPGGTQSLVGHPGRFHRPASLICDE